MFKIRKDISSENSLMTERNNKVRYVTALHAIGPLLFNIVTILKFRTPPRFGVREFGDFWFQGVGFVLFGFVWIVYTKWEKSPYAKLFALTFLFYGIPHVLFQFKPGLAHLFLIFGSLGLCVNLFALEFLHKHNNRVL